MLKRFLAIWLLAQVAPAVPPSAFELQCRRLEPMLEDYHPDCPARLAQLREQAPNLPAGPARAYFYWISSRYAAQTDDTTSRDQFQRLALAEPGVEPLTRALWLHKIDQTQAAGRDGEKDAWLLQQLNQLAEEKPSPRIFYCTQMAQATAASAKGQNSLARTLWRSALALAEKEKWPEQQVEVWLRMHRFLDDHKACWEGALQAAARSRRPDLLWQVFPICRDKKEWQAVVTAFPKAPEALKLQRSYADVFGRDVVTAASTAALRSRLSTPRSKATWPG